MKRKIPPLNALKVFEIAGRMENFSHAAEELCITQSAVSKQIRALEGNLNTQLFSRNAGVVKLTESGQALLETTVKAFDTIEVGARQFYSSKTQEKLTIDVTPSLSSYWMFERVESFSAKYPQIALYFNSDEGDLDWAKSGSDLAIKIMRTKENYPNGELLSHEKLVLVASPNLLRQQPIDTLEDINKHKLIANNSRPNLWGNFFNEFDIKNRDLDTRFSCQHVHMTINAALQGFGLALVSKPLCNGFLKAGKLENPLNIEMDSGRGYYFLSPPHKRDERKVRVFHDWVKNQLSD